jgi:hypothetical protein
MLTQFIENIFMVQFTSIKENQEAGLKPMIPFSLLRFYHYAIAAT